jgi:hypothetical protein
MVSMKKIIICLLLVFTLNFCFVHGGGMVKSVGAITIQFLIKVTPLVIGLNQSRVPPIGPPLILPGSAQNVPLENTDEVLF